MKRTKILSLLLVFAFILSLCSITVFAANVEFGVKLDNLKPKVGEFVVATVYVKNMETIAAVQGTLGFNPEVLTVWNKSKDEAATNGVNGIDDSNFMGLTQVVNDESQTAFEKPISNLLDKAKGLIDFAFSSRLFDAEQNKYLVYNVADSKKDLTVVVLKFKVIANGDPKLRIAKESAGGYYNNSNKNGVILEKKFGEPLTGFSENVEKLAIDGENQNQEPPSDIGTKPPSKDDAKDGKIVGTKPGMEYKPSDSATYIPITEEEISKLPAGTYHIRYAAKPGLYPSNTITVTVGKVSEFDSNKLTWKELTGWSGSKIHHAGTEKGIIVFVE